MKSLEKIILDELPKITTHKFSDTQKIAKGLAKAITNELELMNVALTVIQGFKRRFHKTVKTDVTDHNGKPILKSVIDEKIEWELAERMGVAIRNYLEATS